MADDPWSPERYGRFTEERKQPFVDLLALVRSRPGMRVVDLGCGTGELTREMHEQLGAADTLGIDGSEAMLEKSRAHARDGIHFEHADIAEFAADRRFDLVLSNAALHWLPDHAALFARLTAALVPGGQLAVQVPANFDHASHVVAGEVAAERPFADALGGAAHAQNVLAPEAYASLLERLGYREQHVRLRVYVHRLAARETVVEWVEGSLLTHYRRRLGAELYAAFVARYRERLLPRLDDLRPYPFTFKRIFVWGQH